MLSLESGRPAWSSRDHSATSASPSRPTAQAAQGAASTGDTVDSQARTIAKIISENTLKHLTENPAAVNTVEQIRSEIDRALPYESGPENRVALSRAVELATAHEFHNAATSALALAEKNDARAVFAKRNGFASVCGGIGGLFLTGAGAANVSSHSAAQIVELTFGSTFAVTSGGLVGLYTRMYRAQARESQAQRARVATLQALERQLRASEEV